MDEPSDDASLPWTGRTFGLNDLHFVAGRRKPLTIGVVGPENAGKTTLLAMLYLMISRGVEILEGRRFAGSYTLEGWESIARWLRLDPQSPIRFPPHTTSKGERAPGLLHVALAADDMRKRDILMTDAPGEWFKAWTTKADAPNAEGARWISSYADKFLLIADSEALTGERSGPSQSTLEFLTTRLSTEARGRPVALVWTKTDLVRPGSLIETVEGHFHRRIPNAPVFNVHVPPTDSGSSGGLGYLDDLAAMFAWAMSDSRMQAAIEHPSPTDNTDSFLTFGRRTA